MIDGCLKFEIFLKKSQGKGFRIYALETPQLPSRTSSPFVIFSDLGNVHCGPWILGREWSVIIPSLWHWEKLRSRRLRPVFLALPAFHILLAPRRTISEHPRDTRHCRHGSRDDFQSKKAECEPEQKEEAEDPKGAARTEARPREADHREEETSATPDAAEDPGQPPAGRGIQSEGHRTDPPRRSSGRQLRGRTTQRRPALGSHGIHETSRSGRREPAQSRQRLWEIGSFLGGKGKIFSHGSGGGMREDRLHNLMKLVKYTPRSVIHSLGILFIRSMIWYITPCEDSSSASFLPAFLSAL